MKMEIDRGTVMDHMSGVARVMHYKIDEEDTGMVMDIIANRTYTKKQLAVVREYICNAWDAHVEAGNTHKPFDVTVPNVLDPTFKVRDYGLGLSVEDVERIYVKVAKSTKRNSNSVIGAYGIGSKAAFCYGDSFIVTSWHGGVCSKYVAQIDSEKRARMLHLTSEASNEPSGVEIQVAVKPADCKIFKDNILSVCSNFPTIPNVLGIVETIQPQKKLVFGKSWYVVANEMTRSWDNSFTAMCGHIAYKVDLHDAGAIDLKYPILQGFHLEFDLGEVDIPPSRETLEYTQKTIDAIQNKMKSFEADFVATLQEAVNKAENVFDAMLVIPNYVAYKGFTFKGVNLGELAELRKGHLVKSTVYAPSRRSSQPYTRVNSDTKIFTSDRIAIVFEDAPRIPSRINHSLPKGFVKVIVIDPNDKVSCDKLHLDIWPAKNIFKASQLQAPSITRQSGERETHNFFTVRTVDGNRSYGKIVTLRETELDNIPDGKKVYVTMKGSNLEHGMDYNTFMIIMNKVIEKGMFLYAVRKRVASSLDNDWIPLSKVISDKIVSISSKITAKHLDNVGAALPKNFLANFGNINSKDCIDIVEDIEIIKEANSLKDDIYFLVHAARTQGITFNNPFDGKGTAQSEPLMKKIDAFFAKYPMLKYVQKTLDNSYESDIVEYIKSKE